MRSTAVLLLLAVLASTQCSGRIIEIGGHKGWTFNIYRQWTPPPIYMWDQLAFTNTQSFIEPADVWQLPDEEALLNCNFTKAIYVGNASTGQEVLTPPYLLSYATDFFFAAEANNGCQANQKIKISVLQGAAPPGLEQFAPAPAPAPAPVPDIPPTPAPAPAPIEFDTTVKMPKDIPDAPASAPSVLRIRDGLMMTVAAILGSLAIFV